MDTSPPKRVKIDGDENLFHYLIYSKKSLVISLFFTFSREESLST